jgi:hypothetical protein
MAHVRFAWEPESAPSRPAMKHPGLGSCTIVLRDPSSRYGAAVAHYKQRPDQQSRVAIDELRTDDRSLDGVCPPQSLARTPKVNERP